MIYLIIFFTSFFSFTTSAEIVPPNYNFTLDQFNIFHPGQLLPKIKEKYGKGRIVFTQNEMTTYEFFVQHQRYNFPVFVQTYRKKVIDFYTPLPSYFLHNIFHQSLINRLGKQDSYKRSEHTAVYNWRNKKGFTYTYSGQCSFTCYPVYYHIVLQNPPEKFLSILQRLTNNTFMMRPLGQEPKRKN